MGSWGRARESGGHLRAEGSELTPEAGAEADLERGKGSALGAEKRMTDP